MKGMKRDRAEREGQRLWLFRRLSYHPHHPGLVPDLAFQFQHLDFLPAVHANNKKADRFRSAFSWKEIIPLSVRTTQRRAVR